MPPAWRSSNTFFDFPGIAAGGPTGYVPLPTNPAPPSYLDADSLVLKILRDSLYPVDVLNLGPFTGLDRALQADPELFTSRLGTLYYSGGSPDN